MPYMTGFQIVDHPRIKPIELSMDFGDKAFVNLIITGSNGSGKSTLLQSLWNLIRRKINNQNSVFYSSRKEKEGGHFYALVQDYHRLQYREFPGKVPEPVTPIMEQDSRASKQFVPYLKHQYLQMLLAKANNETSRSQEIEQWLTDLSQEIGSLFEIDGLKMTFDSKTYELRFVEPGGMTYNFSQLSAGFSAVLDIVGELIMRIDASAQKHDAMSVSGIALVDEIDAHLHPRIQEKILPFLTRMFPRVQLVVATHSPAIIGSISNAYVFDLDRMESCTSEEYMGTPYGQVMTSHFGLETDFGDEITKELKEAKKLIEQTDLNPEEEARRWTLIQKLRKTQHPLIMAAYGRELEKRALAKELAE